MKALEKLTISELESHLEDVQTCLEKKRLDASPIKDLVEKYQEIYDVSHDMNVTVTLQVPVNLFTDFHYSSLSLQHDTLVQIEETDGAEPLYEQALDEIWSSSQVQKWKNNITKKAKLLQKQVQQYAKEYHVSEESVWDQIEKEVYNE